MAETADPNQITVRVRLFAELRRFLPPGADEWPPIALPRGATCAAAAAAVGIDLAAEEEVIIGVGDTLARPDTVLRDGDEVVLFSPMAGG